MIMAKTDVPRTGTVRYWICHAARPPVFVQFVQVLAPTLLNTAEQYRYVQYV
jgi:hypothetical protein